MSVTGLTRGHSMGAWIQEENVVCWLKICFMFLQRTELISGIVYQLSAFPFDEYMYFEFSV